MRSDEFQKVLQSLIPGYLENRRQELETIAHLIRMQDFPKIKSLGHQLKGHGPSYGFDELGKIGLALEEAAEAQDLGRLQDELERMRRYLSSVN